MELPPDEPVKQVRKAIIQHARNFYCPTVMWDRILSVLSPENAQSVLNSLAPEEQSELRRVYHERPSSFESEANRDAVVGPLVGQWLSASQTVH